jgi:hypothetical protein
MGDRRRRPLRSPVAAGDDALSDALMRSALCFAQEEHPHPQHLVRTLGWLDELAPGGRPAMRIAALLHDIERAFPDADSPFVSGRDWALEYYVDYHQGRCARLLTGWLIEHGAELSLIPDAVALVAVHERGGWPDANLIQAVDSLSFIETLGPLVRQWIADGTTSRESGLEKMSSMWERIQVPAAREAGRELYERVMRECAAA